MSKLLTKDELLRKFELAYVQRTTIDANKCESFGSLMQGFFAVKEGDKTHLQPFMFYDKKSLAKIKRHIAALKTSFLGVAFVQHYIHYT